MKAVVDAKESTYYGFQDTLGVFANYEDFKYFIFASRILIHQFPDRFSDPIWNNIDFWKMAWATVSDPVKLSWTDLKSFSYTSWDVAKQVSFDSVELDKVNNTITSISIPNVSILWIAGYSRRMENVINVLEVVDLSKYSIDETTWRYLGSQGLHEGVFN